MTSIPVVFRQAQALYAILLQDVDLDIAGEMGWAHAVIEAVARRDHRDWQEVAEEFRVKHNIPRGTGYNKETE